jgi:plastocyanin
VSGRRSLAVVTGALAVTSLAVPAVATSRKAPAAVGLGLREYSITVYRGSVPEGRVAFNSKNFGEDAHNIQVLGPKGFRSAVSPEVAPFGGRDRFTVTLKRPGTYTLICTLSDHASLGMTAKLKVRKTKAGKKT